MATTSTDNIRQHEKNAVEPGALEQARRVLERLRVFYGEPSTDRKHPDPMAELVQTILSQNTSDANSERAYASLRARFASWEEVLDADEASIADAIRSGGLAEIKARRIKAVLEEIRKQHGTLDLDFLADWETEAIRQWLTSLPGVGPKTASCVLLFSLDRPAIPVDTHVYRVSRRLGLVSPGTPVSRSHLVLESLVSPTEMYPFHMLLIRHGRQICKAASPRCSSCPLADICPRVGVVGQESPATVP